MISVPTPHCPESFAVSLVIIVYIFFPLFPIFPIGKPQHHSCCVVIHLHGERVTSLDSSSVQMYIPGCKKSHHLLLCRTLLRLTVFMFTASSHCVVLSLAQLQPQHLVWSIARDPPLFFPRVPSSCPSLQYGHVALWLPLHLQNVLLFSFNSSYVYKERVKCFFLISSILSIDGVTSWPFRLALSGLGAATEMC